MRGFWRVIIEACSLVLAWRRISPFVLTNVGCLRLSFWCISSISLQYFSAVMVSPDLIKLRWIKLAEDQQTVTLTFSWWSFGFGKCCGALSASSHSALWLSFRIHFSSQVTIRLSKGPFWFWRRRQMRFLNVCVYDSHSIHVEPIYSFFLTLPVNFGWRKMVVGDTLSSST